MHRVLDDTLQLLEPQLRSNQIEIVRNYNREIPKVFGNSGQLQQVFTNLLLNARDSIVGGGRITLETSSNGHDGAMVSRSRTLEWGSIPPTSQNLRSLLHHERRGPGNRIGSGRFLRHCPEHSGHISVNSAPGRAQPSASLCNRAVARAPAGHRSVNPIQKPARQQGLGACAGRALPYGRASAYTL